MKLDQDTVDRIINGALREDLGAKGDITTKSIFPMNELIHAEILARKPGIVAGLEIAKRVFELVDSQVEFSP